MKGTKKQVQWAEKIRENVLSVWNEVTSLEGLDEYIGEVVHRRQMDTAKEDVQKAIEEASQLLKGIEEADDASQWINKFKGQNEYLGIIKTIGFILGKSEHIEILCTAKSKMERRGTLKFRKKR